MTKDTKKNKKYKKLLKYLGSGPKKEKGKKKDYVDEEDLDNEDVCDEEDLDDEDVCDEEDDKENYTEYEQDNYSDSDDEMEFELIDCINNNYVWRNDEYFPANYQNKYIYDDRQMNGKSYNFRNYITYVNNCIKKSNINNLLTINFNNRSQKYFFGIDLDYIYVDKDYDDPTFKMYYTNLKNKLLNGCKNKEKYDDVISNIDKILEYLIESYNRDYNPVSNPDSIDKDIISTHYTSLVSLNEYISKLILENHHYSTENNHFQTTRTHKKINIFKLLKEKTKYKSIFSNTADFYESLILVFNNTNINTLETRQQLYKSMQNECINVKFQLDALDLIHDVIKIKDKDKNIYYDYYIYLEQLANHNRFNFNDVKNVYNDQIKIRELKNKLVDDLKKKFKENNLIIKDTLKYEKITKFSKFLHFFEELDKMYTLAPNNFIPYSEIFPKFFYRESGNILDVVSFINYRKILNIKLKDKFDNECKNINDNLFQIIDSLIIDRESSKKLLCQVDMKPISSFDACKQKMDEAISSDTVTFEKVFGHYDYKVYSLVHSNKNTYHLVKVSVLNDDFAYFSFKNGVSINLLLSSVDIPRTRKGTGTCVGNFLKKDNIIINLLVNNSNFMERYDVGMKKIITDKLYDEGKWFLETNSGMNNLLTLGNKTIGDLIFSVYDNKQPSSKKMICSLSTTDLLVESSVLYNFLIGNSDSLQNIWQKAGVNNSYTPGIFNETSEQKADYIIEQLSCFLSYMDWRIKIYTKINEKYSIDYNSSIDFLILSNLNKIFGTNFIERSKFNRIISSLSFIYNEYEKYHDYLYKNKNDSNYKNKYDSLYDYITFQIFKFEIFNKKKLIEKYYSNIEGEINKLMDDSIKNDDGSIKNDVDKKNELTIFFYNMPNLSNILYFNSLSLYENQKDINWFNVLEEELNNKYPKDKNDINVINIDYSNIEISKLGKSVNVEFSSNFKIEQNLMNLGQIKFNCKIIAKGDKNQQIYDKVEELYQKNLLQNNVFKRIIPENQFFSGLYIRLFHNSINLSKLVLSVMTHLNIEEDIITKLNEEGELNNNIEFQIKYLCKFSFAHNERNDYKSILLNKFKDNIYNKKKK